MKNKKPLDKKTQAILRGLEIAYEKMVKFKKYKGTPLIVARNVVIVEIQPDDIEPTTRYYAHEEEI